MLDTAHLHAHSMPCTLVYVGQMLLSGGARRRLQQFGQHHANQIGKFNGNAFGPGASNFGPVPTPVPTAANVGTANFVQQLPSTPTLPPSDYGIGGSGGATLAPSSVGSAGSATASPTAAPQLLPGDLNSTAQHGILMN